MSLAANQKSARNTAVPVYWPVIQLMWTKGRHVAAEMLDRGQVTKAISTESIMEVGHIQKVQILSVKAIDYENLPFNSLNSSWKQRQLLTQGPLFIYIAFKND